MQPVDIVFSFDTTGSMYPCLSEVRRTVENTMRELFRNILDLRVGLVAHGDYNDNPYTIKILDLTTNEKELCEFVRTAQQTHGFGNDGECYELVLHDCRRLTWRAGARKVLVMIGDEQPHPPNFHQNTRNLNWKNELEVLCGMGVAVYGVQCLNWNYGRSDYFWKGLAQDSGGLHLRLQQFRHAVDMILGVAYKQTSPEKLEELETRIVTEGRMNRDLAQIYTALSGRTYDFSKYDTGLQRVPSGRFQILTVPRDQTITDFVQDRGLRFAPGRGFYELSKRVLVQAGKEVVLEQKATGDLFTGPEARRLLKLPEGASDYINPRSNGLSDYNVFIQSTSYSRKLIGGTRFLYEVEGWR